MHDKIMQSDGDAPQIGKAEPPDASDLHTLFTTARLSMISSKILDKYR